MPTSKINYRCLLLFLCITFIAASCNESSEVPEPEIFTAYPQPKTWPLEFTDPKPLHWDTLPNSRITPKVFPLDFSKLKPVPYDSNTFRPASAPPVVTSFDFDKLPSRPFDLDTVPSHPLKMTITALPENLPSVKVQAPTQVPDIKLDLRIWQQIVGLRTIVYNIVKDKNGIFWLGTATGIYRFDGTELTTVVPDVVGFGVSFDNEGNLWYLQFGEQRKTSIGKIDFRKRTLETAPLNLILKGISLSSNPDKKGRFWFGNFRNAGALVIDLGKMTYQVLDSTAGFTQELYYIPTADSDDNIWLGSGQGAKIISLSEKKVFTLGKENGLSSDKVGLFKLGRDGQMWAVFPKSLQSINIKSGKIKSYVYNEDGDFGPGILYEDHTGKWWINQPNGYYIFDPQNNSVRSIRSSDGLTYEGSYDIIEYRPGEMMLANVTALSNYGTIYFLNQSGKSVFPFKNILAISTKEDSRGKLWVGTNDGLLIVDSARRSVYQLTPGDGLAFKQVESVTENGGKVIITTDGGYNIYDPQRNEWSRVTKQEGLRMDTIYSLLTDHRGALWVTGNYKGIMKVNPSDPYTLNLSSKGGLNGNTVIQANNVSDDNKIWLVTTERGPNIIDPENNTIQFIKNIPEMDTASYKSMTVDTHGRLWIVGSGNYNYGLYVIDFNNKTISKFTTAEGLADNSTNSVIEYKGKLIVNTDKRINIITPPELSASHQWEVGLLAHSAGFKKVAGNFMSDAISKRGEYFWGDEKLGVIYGIEEDTTRAANYITGIRVNGKPLSFGMVQKQIRIDSASGDQTNLNAIAAFNKGNIRYDSVSGPFTMPVDLSLPYDQNVIRFQFTEGSAGRYGEIRYAYTLEGQDKHWTFTNEDKTESYMNLSPGHYTFKVASRWINGKWNKPASLSFTIRPPWYNTWWAYLIYFVVAMSLLRLYIIFRSRKLRKENKILEEKVNQRTAELQKAYEDVEELGQIGRKITSSLSVEKIIGTAYNNVNALMDASVFGIGIYNPEKNALDFPSTYEGGEHLPAYSNRLDEPNRFSVACFSSGKDIIMNDVGEQYNKYIQTYIRPSAGQHANSLVYLPLIINEKKLGVLTVQSFNKNAYTENHLNMLRNIANYTAIAIENAGSYDDLKAAQNQIIQSEKMASLGELTAGIAHEIQNPLNFVNNFSEVNMELIKEMGEEVKNGNMDEVQDLAKNILSNEEKIVFHGKRADGIVKAMLQHSRNSGNAKEPTDINKLGDEYLRLAFHGMRAKDKTFNSGMNSDFDNSIPKISVVPQEVGRALLNLLTNAFYEVNEKRKLGIEGYQPMVKLTTAKEGNKVVITVSDNGRGIPDDIAQKVFQPFFTTKPTGKGTGLGLSLSYDIITKQHSGELSLHSVPGESTTFKITLPVN